MYRENVVCTKEITCDYVTVMYNIVGITLVKPVVHLIMHYEL
jgi:hypothetical protein